MTIESRKKQSTKGQIVWSRAKLYSRYLNFIIIGIFIGWILKTQNGEISGYDYIMSLLDKTSGFIGAFSITWFVEFGAIFVTFLSVLTKIKTAIGKLISKGNE